MMDAALEYAGELGWPVFPLAERDKVPKIGRAQGGRGLHDATTDEAQIRAWWERWPHANIGLRTGIHFDVIDIDGRAGQEAIVAYLREHGWQIPNGPWSWTGGGGDHCFVLPTRHGNRAGLLDHVDYRGDGGYVVAPPSIHPNGEPYQWIADSSDLNMRSLFTPLEPAPDWLVALLEPAPQQRVVGVPLYSGPGTSAYGQRALETEAGRVLLAPEGQRNHTLNRAAFSLGQLVGGGVLGANDVVDTLVSAATRSGLTELEAEATITSGLRAGLARPRTATP